VCAHDTLSGGACGGPFGDSASCDQTTGESLAPPSGRFDRAVQYMPHANVPGTQGAQHTVSITVASRPTAPHVWVFHKYRCAQNHAVNAASYCATYPAGVCVMAQRQQTASICASDATRLHSCAASGHVRARFRWYQKRQCCTADAPSEFETCVRLLPQATKLKRMACDCTCANVRPPEVTCHLPPSWATRQPIHTNRLRRC
jgi:hypothetical protein